MNSKITLYSDKDLIEAIKKYAKENGVSVSKLVNDYFKSLLSQNKKKFYKSSKTQKLYGILGSDISSKDYKEYLEKRYL